MPRPTPPIKPAAPVVDPLVREAIEVTAEIAALAIHAFYGVSGYALDVNSNEAQKQSDGSIRLSIHQKDGSGHKRVFVRVPAVMSLEIAMPQDRDITAPTE